jgi:hypothetical protein
MLRIAHCLDNRLTDGGKVVSLRTGRCFIPQKHYFYASDTHFFTRRNSLGSYRNNNHYYYYYYYYFDSTAFSVSWPVVSVLILKIFGLGPRIPSASNRNEYQKQKNNVSGD